MYCIVQHNNNLLLLWIHSTWLDTTLFLLSSSTIMYCSIMLSKIWSNLLCKSFFHLLQQYWSSPNTMNKQLIYPCEYTHLTWLDPHCLVACEFESPSEHVLQFIFMILLLKFTTATDHYHVLQDRYEQTTYLSLLDLTLFIYWAQACNAEATGLRSGMFVGCCLWHWEVVGTFFLELFLFCFVF